MKRNFIIRLSFIAMLILASINCGGGGSDTTTTASPQSAPVNSSPVTFTTPIDHIEPTAAAVTSLITGTTYHVNPATGNDLTGTGTLTSPWQTITKANTVVQGGDCVLLASGNYGDVTFSVNSTSNKYIIYMNETGASPVFSSITISSSQYVILYGVKSQAAMVVQTVDSEYPNCDDPQYADADGFTYRKTRNPLTIRYSSHIKVINSEICGPTGIKYLTPYAINISYSHQVSIAGCDIHTSVFGIMMTYTTESEYYYNHIHHICGTALGIGTQSNNALIEGNHVHDITYTFTDDYCNRKLNSNYHNAHVSLRSVYVIIRNNILHDGGNSAIIKTSTDAGGAPRYDNLLIENNLIYDAAAYYALELTAAAENITIRNNIIVGHDRNLPYGPEKFDMPVRIASVASGSNGSGISFYNNIVVGKVGFREWWQNVNERNNIYYAFSDQNFINLDNSKINPASKIVCWGNMPDMTSYFRTGFFSGAMRFDWHEDDGTDFMSNGNFASKGHHQLLNFSYQSTSDAINFGDAANDPSDILGNLDASNEFIIKSAVTRSASNHNAGCY